jgi:hypothetical protein
MNVTHKIRSLLTATRIIAIVSAVLLIPIDLFLAFGITFTFREPEPWISWIFVWFAFLLDVPALLLGVFKPRAGAYWVLANAIISGTMVATFLVRDFMNATGTTVPIGRSLWMLVMSRMFAMFLAFWGAKFAYFWFCSASRSRDVAVGDNAR